MIGPGERRFTSGGRAPRRGTVEISRQRLAELERKEKAHDAYLRATQRMAVRQRKVSGFGTDWARGYSAALAEFGMLVVEESSHE